MREFKIWHDHMPIKIKAESVFHNSDNSLYFVVQEKTIAIFLRWDYFVEIGFADEE